MRYRYIATATALAVLIISIGLLAGGRLVYRFLPESDAETVVIDRALPIGSPVERTDVLVRRIESAAKAQVETKSVGSVIGMTSNLDTGSADAVAPHRAQLFVELKEAELRERSSKEVVAAIRASLAGKLEEADRVTFSEISGGPAGADITLRLRGPDSSRLRAVAERAKIMLAEFAGVDDIADDDNLGQLELRIRLRPGAAAMGLAVSDVARQIRGYLYGLDAHIFAERREDIHVRVRLDEQSRRSLTELRGGWVINARGDRVPITEIADLESVSTYSTIRRVDRQRVINITADTAPGLSPESIVSKLDLTALRKTYPDVHIETAGRQKQQREAFGSLPYGFLAAMLMIYVILAWLFESYFQPLVVLVVVPFSLVGVIWGHLLLGYQLNFLSVIGFVALSGIVVNDSLILVSFFNERRAAGDSVFDALIASGRARLRAILLTTITTFFGLTPLMLERSFQARFLIPMAISIAMGLVAATALVLVVLPCLILIGDDLRQVLHRLWHGHAGPENTIKTSPVTESAP